MLQAEVARVAAATSSRGTTLTTEAPTRTGRKGVPNHPLAFRREMPDWRANSHPEDRTMTKYLISFPGSAMDIPDEDIAAVGEAAHAVIREAKDAGVYVFGGGINEDVAPLM